MASSSHYIRPVSYARQPLHSPSVLCTAIFLPKRCLGAGSHSQRFDSFYSSRRDFLSGDGATLLFVAPRLGSPMDWICLFGPSLLEHFSSNELQQAPRIASENLLLANKPELDRLFAHNRIMTTVHTEASSARKTMCYVV
jgi:hypothetical protein